MKKNIYLSLVLLLSFSSCKNEPNFVDNVYLTGTLTSPTVKFLVEDQSNMGLTVTSSAKASEDVKITLKAAPELLEQFNTATNRNCQLPPEGSYSVEGSEVTIKQGKAQSTQLEISADADKLKEGVSYCLPISIKSVSGGGLKILETSRTAYVMLTKVINIKTAYLAGNNSFDIPSFAGDKSPVKALGAMTLEMKVMPVSFNSLISSLCGCEENFLFRFGDGGNVRNRLQLAKGAIGSAFHPDYKDHYESYADGEFETGRWYHFAAVYDGQYLRVYLDGQQIQFVETKNGGTINLSMAYDGHTWDDTFSIGRSVGHQRFFDGCVSECRIWNIPRTQAQLQDGVCYVDPTTPGLIAYWRFNGQLQDDGTVLDETGHGYNAHPYRTVQWRDKQKCPF